MSTINRLSSVDVLQPSDQIPVWDSSNGDTRKASMSTLLAFVESYFADPDYSTRIVAPAVDYFNVDIGATGDSIWLIVNPTLNFTDGTITLPPASSAVNGQEITVVFTAGVTNLSVTSLGATVLGEPASIGGYDSFRVRYNSTQLTWYTLDTTGSVSGGGSTSSVVRSDFTGDGTTTIFTLTTAPTTSGNELQIFIDGVYQERAGYSVAGSNVIFSEAPPSLSTIEVIGQYTRIDNAAELGYTQVAVYDFAIDGGAIGDIPINATIPADATITYAFYEVITEPTSAGAATLSFGVDANDPAGLKAPTAIGSYTVGYGDLLPDNTAANFTTKTTSTRNIIMSIGAATLTAGKINVYFTYSVSP